MQTYDEIGIPTTEIEADGFITRAETLERINANKAKPAKKCVYPTCEECDDYHGHYCTVPMVISKQFFLMLRDKLEEMEHNINTLENIVYGEISGSKE